MLNVGCGFINLLAALRLVASFLNTTKSLVVNYAASEAIAPMRAWE